MPKPARLSVEQAAAVPTAALTALRGLRDAGAGPRDLMAGTAAALRHVETGYARGKVVVTVP